MKSVNQPLKRILNHLVCIAVLSATQSAFAVSAGAEDHDTHRPATSGVYYGMLPCDDCYGVKTTLALNANNSYIKITQMTGKSQRDYVEKGKYSLGDKNNTIVLTPRKGSTQSQYMVANNKLFQLDNNGKPFSGKEAERYVLNRTEMSNPEEMHDSH